MDLQRNALSDSVWALVLAFGADTALACCSRRLASGLVAGRAIAHLLAARARGGGDVLGAALDSRYGDDAPHELGRLCWAWLPSDTRGRVRWLSSLGRLRWQYDRGWEWALAMLDSVPLAAYLAAERERRGLGIVLADDMGVPLRPPGPLLYEGLDSWVQVARHAGHYDRLALVAWLVRRYDSHRVCAEALRSAVASYPAGGSQVVHFLCGTFAPGKTDLWETVRGTLPYAVPLMASQWPSNLVPDLEALCTGPCADMELICTLLLTRPLVADDRRGRLRATIAAVCLRRLWCFSDYAERVPALVAIVLGLVRSTRLTFDWELHASDVRWLAAQRPHFHMLPLLRQHVVALASSGRAPSCLLDRLPEFPPPPRAFSDEFLLGMPRAAGVIALARQVL